LSTKEDLLLSLTIKELRELAKENRIKLVKEGFLWDSPATRKEDIIGLLLESPRITKKKILAKFEPSKLPKRKKGKIKPVIQTAPKSKPSENILGTVSDIKSSINRWKNVVPKITGKNKEKKMTLSMTGFLANSYPNIILEQNLGGNRIDVVIEKIGIEAKYRPNQSEVNRLYGQVDDYLRYLDYIIVVFFDTNQAMMNNFKRKIKTGGYESQISVVGV